MHHQDKVETFDAEGFALSARPGEARLQKQISILIALAIIAAAAAALAPFLTRGA